jgi:EmrB/QacA subfamily drug resistance transporter
LDFSDGDRQWVITGYSLAFGGLLLLGGRLADRLGRARALMIGLVGFAVASTLGGLATDLIQLTLARATQGAFAALLAPTVLSLLALTFTEPRERAKAFALFGAIAGSGGAIGLVLGGLLAEQLSWRACLLVNVPITAVAAFGTRFVRNGSAGGHREPLDAAGAVLATAGLVALVAGCSRAATEGWASATVVGPVAAGAALLSLFALRESRTASPLLPPRVVLERNRAGACVAVALAVAGMLGMFLYLTYYFQVVLGYRPVTAGVSFLPLSAAVFASAQLLPGRLLPRVAPRALIVPGLLVAASAMLLLTRLTPTSGYLALVLPAELLLGIGMGCVFTPAISTATRDRAHAGVAAAVVTVAMQVGGSLGVAVLNTVAATRPTPALGFSTGAGVAAAMLAAAAALAAVLITAPAPSTERTLS